MKVKVKTNISLTIAFHTTKSLFFSPSFLVRVVELACFCPVRYEEQLSASLEREKNLEMMGAHIKLKCENMKTEFYHVNEQLRLLQHKNQVSVKLN